MKWLLESLRKEDINDCLALLLMFFLGRAFGVVAMGKPWTIFCSIVSLLMLYRVKFFWYLGSGGWYQRLLLLFFFACRNWFGEHLSNIWNMVPTCIMWLVWQEHNTCTFENIERPLDLFKGVRSLWTTFFFIAQ